MNTTVQSGTRRNRTESYQATQIMPTTILLVEDEAAVREVTREALEMGGYHVLTADGAAAATHIAGDASTTIDLLLTDVIMPGMNGPELARQVKAIRPQIATLFMTGYADNEILRVATMGAPHQHIKKPFTVHSLLAGVSDALRARRNGSNDDQDIQDPQHPSS
jgi:two-component system, cell cycle sensor histidine kinase and response regulator CckA